MSFEFLDHTADMIVKATGVNIIEAFEQGALGYYSVMTDLELIEHNIIKEVKVESEDLESLLFDWIDQLIFLFDTELFISNAIKISMLEKIEEDEKFLLEATLKGEEFVIGKHSQKSEVKAMTYSFMKITDTTIEFTLDL